MIRTHVYEIIVDSLSKITEKDIGWCIMPEVPVEKRPPQDGDKPQQPLLIKVNGERYAIIGHSWEITPKAVADLPDDPKDIDYSNRENALAAVNLPDTVLVLIVQKIQVVNSSGPALVRAGPQAMDQLRALVPEPGAKKN